MIKANELMAGNWILGEEIHLYNHNIHSNGFIKMTAYGIYMLNEHPELAEKYNPIPLTLEILVACGFMKVDDKYRKEVNYNIYEFSIREQFEVENGNCGIMGISHDPEDIEMGDGTIHHEDYSWTGFAWHIKYLHQLQNLWFVATGKELPVSL